MELNVTFKNRDEGYINANFMPVSLLSHKMGFLTWHLFWRVLLHGMPYGNVNSWGLGDTYMRQWVKSSLVQVMACRLFDDQPLPEPMPKPMLTYCQLYPQEQISMTSESKYQLKVSSAILSRCQYVKSWVMRHLQCSGLKSTQPLTINVCTPHDSVTVVTCAKFRSDWLTIFWTRAV